MRFHVAAALLACGLAGTGCDADLETGCIDGTCTGASSASGGPCAGDDHDLPCGVYEILSNVCQQCHVPGGQGPFPLQEYCDTQQQYGKKPIWVRMQTAIKPDAFPRMPFMQDPLPDEQMATLNAWFETCGRNGTHGDDMEMGGATSYDYNLCAGAQNGPPPSCGGGGGGAGGGGAPAGGAPAGGAPAGGAGGS